jgi:hypothetical protein
MSADGPGELVKLTVSGFMERYLNATAGIGISASSRAFTMVYRVKTTFGQVNRGSVFGSWERKGNLHLPLRSLLLR